MDKRLARVAIGGLWNLSFVEEHKGAIAEAGGVKAIVDLIIKWPDNHKDLRLAAGALANLVGDDKCRKELALANGVHALVMLACNCESEDVLKQVARALATSASANGTNGNNAEQELVAMEALVQLTRSPHEVVKLEATGAMWNLLFDDRIREVIASAGGVEALLWCYLFQLSCNGFPSSTSAAFSYYSAQYRIT